MHEMNMCACTCDESAMWNELAHDSTITLIKDQFKIKMYWFKIIST